MDTNVIVSSSNGSLNKHGFFVIWKPPTNDEKLVKNRTGNIWTNFDGPLECFWSAIIIVPILNVTRYRRINKRETWTLSKNDQTCWETVIQIADISFFLVFGDLWLYKLFVTFHMVYVCNGAPFDHCPSLSIFYLCFNHGHYRGENNLIGTNKIQNISLAQYYLLLWDFHTMLLLPVRALLKLIKLSFYRSWER